MDLRPRLTLRSLHAADSEMHATSLRRWMSRWAGALSGDPVGLRAARGTFVALLCLALIYRLRLGLLLGDTFTSEVPQPLRAVLRQLGCDALWSLAVASWVLLWAQLVAATGVLSLHPLLTAILRGLGWLGVAGILLLCGVLAQTQHGVFFATGNGLTAELLRESLDLSALKEIVSLLSAFEIAIIVAPVVIWQGFLLLPQRLRGLLDRAMLSVAALAVMVAILRSAAPLPDALLYHPVAYLLVDVGQGLAHRSAKRSLVSEANAAAGREGQTLRPDALLDAPRDANGDPSEDDAAWLGKDGAATNSLPVMALSSPPFLVENSPQKSPAKALPKAAGQKPYHILYIVMESTGFDLALRSLGGAATQRSDDVAMPFLRSLSSQGLFLSNHYSSGNSSPRGIFSLLSGLYVLPEVAIFDVRKDNHLPSLVSYLGPRYRRFLVTPGSLDWYFPQGFLLHSGLTELWGYHALPVRKNAPGGRAHARDEFESVSFFLRRLDEQLATGSPVLSVYYSFVAHWPYPDYGPSTHVAHPTRPQNAYCNNLRYLDQQIERIYKHLQERGVLDDTIVVLAGDHGEAFGQHPHNYTHSRMSYNENVRTPALLLNRHLFPARVVTAPTSHVDIVPTLLDALAIPYDPSRLQGESLYSQSFRRKYIFFYGNEDTLSSVSADDVKLQVSLRDGGCWAFNLKTDPEERHRLACSSQPALKDQQQALLLYRRHQQTALRRYNQIAKQGLPLALTPAGPATTPGSATGAAVASAAGLAPAASPANLDPVTAPGHTAPREPSRAAGAAKSATKPGLEAPAGQVEPQRKATRKIAVHAKRRRASLKVATQP